MVVKLSLVHGGIQVFERADYMVSSVKEMHPDILKVEIFNGNVRIVKRERQFKWFYEKFLYKPLPEDKKEKSQEDENVQGENVENKTE